MKSTASEPRGRLLQGANDSAWNMNAVMKSSSPWHCLDWRWSPRSKEIWPARTTTIGFPSHFAIAQMIRVGAGWLAHWQARGEGPRRLATNEGPRGNACYWGDVWRLTKCCLYDATITTYAACSPLWWEEFGTCNGLPLQGSCSCIICTTDALKGNTTTI